MSPALYLHCDDLTAWLREVVRRLVPAGTDLPLFGDDDWLAAPDPVRLASALRAAETWRVEGLYAAARLEDELRAHRANVAADEQAEWHEAAAWVHGYVSHAELEDRRAEIVRPARKAALTVPAAVAT